METHEHEQEFERRLFDLLRTYAQYSTTKRKLRALNDNPEEYMLSGTLLVPNTDASQENAGLLEARNSLFSSLRDQSLSIGEPLTGLLPEAKRFDLTYTPQTIHDIIDSMCEFVTAATSSFATTAVGDVNIYAEDKDRY